MRFITRFLTKSLLWLLGFTFAVGFAAVIAVGLYLGSLMPQLPPISNVNDIELKVPLRVYTSDNQLIAEYGDERRQPVDISRVPEVLKHAVLASEDARFYDHIGVDFLGVIRAALANYRSGGRGQGASTITMQVARNFFLTREKTYDRKIKEALLSFKLEDKLTKDQILELYLNKIFLGHRAYGFAAAAKVYYDSDLSELTTAQLAMLAGLPKAPSTMNPLSNPSRALNRRNYVLTRMNENGWLSDEELELAKNAPVSADHHVTKVDVKSPYVAEEIRKCVVEHFSDSAYSSGLRVYTTIKPGLQQAAVKAVRSGIVGYETRHGWRGPVATLDLATFDSRVAINDRLNEEESSADLKPAVVLGVEDQTAQLLMAGDRNQQEGVDIEIPWDGLKWARRFETVERIGPELTSAGEILEPGMLVYVEPHVPSEAQESDQPQTEPHWRLSQLPDVSAALISLEPETGAIKAMAGGYDFYLSKFNRVTQAERQPGSNIKPFIYSAAIDTQDVTPATVISGAPLTISNPDIELPWRPENYSGKFVGPTRLRQALAKSLNLVSVRLLKHIGTDYTRDYLEKFGFEREKLPDGLPLALGATSITPLNLAGAYAVFANGGYRIQPHLIERVEDSKGNPIDWNALITNPASRQQGSSDSSVADSTGDLSKDQYAVTFDQSDSDASTEDEPAAPVVISNPLCLAMQTRVCRECEQIGEAQSLDDLQSASNQILIDESTGTSYKPAKRVISSETAFLMQSLMGEVVRSGTARKAKDQLGRNDLAGKTGTTNDFRDAWFSGFNSNVTTTVWFGYDQPQSLGRGESGARAALPIWIDYMRTALDGVDEKTPTVPPGIVQRHVDSETGQPVIDGAAGSLVEYFKASNAPISLSTGSQFSSSNDQSGDGLPTTTDANRTTQPVDARSTRRSDSSNNGENPVGTTDDPATLGSNDRTIAPVNSVEVDTTEPADAQDESLF